MREKNSELQKLLKKLKISGKHSSDFHYPEKRARYYCEVQFSKRRIHEVPK